MVDEDRTKEQLISELVAMRQGVATLEAAEAECRRTKGALWENEEKLRSTISSMDDLVFVLDKKGVFLDSYQAASEPALYLPPELFLGKPFQDILPPHVVELLEGAIDTLVTTGQTQQFDYPLGMAGSELWYSAKVAQRKGRAGEFVGVTIVARDITRRKQAKEALQQQTRRLRALTAQLSEVTEAERQRLARELHDQVGQNLTALGINLSIVRSQIPGEAAAPVRSRLDDSLLLVEQTAERIRDVMADLRPPVLDDYGLVAALHWYGEQFAGRTGLSVAVEGEKPVPRLVPRVENALFRIAQEALTNVAKHAQATRVTVTVEVESGVVRLVIADDGKGFNPAHMADPGEAQGWGLLTMTERAEAVGGRCSIESDPGRGTRVIVEAPRSRGRNQ